MLSRIAGSCAFEISSQMALMDMVAATADVYATSEARTGSRMASNQHTQAQELDRARGAISSQAVETFVLIGARARAEVAEKLP